MLFAGAPDTDLHQYTDQKFPATLRPDLDTHPVFVLQCFPAGHLLFPCSSKGRKQQRYIPKGSVLGWKCGDTFHPPLPGQSGAKDGVFWAVFSIDLQGENMEQGEFIARIIIV